MQKTKALFKEKISNLLQRRGTDAVLSEAALPAYAHRNPIIDYIFWQRPQIAANFITSSGKQASDLLDFGCGTGVFSYEMAQRGHRVMALDLDLTPVKILREGIAYPPTIDFTEGDFLTLDFQERRFDFIVALDVLEHIPLQELPQYLHKMYMLLKPGGQVLVSGPTENILYQLGRKMAGADFTGDYHETTIGAIKSVFEKTFSVRVLRRLIWPFTLFEIFVATKRQAV